MIDVVVSKLNQINSSIDSVERIDFNKIVLAEKGPGFGNCWPIQGINIPNLKELTLANLKKNKAELEKEIYNLLKEKQQ